MEELYEKLLDLLGEIPEIRHIDLNAGQLQLKKPPLAYPAVLVRISEIPENIDHHLQTINAQFELTVVDKYLSESNSLAPKTVRAKGLKYMRLNAVIHQKLQGYKDSRFEPFENTGKQDVNLRIGLKSVVQTWETAWRVSNYETN